MRGDCVWVLTKAEKEAYQNSNGGNNNETVTYRTLSLNSTGEDVTRLQQKLVELGYLNADQVSGTYLSSTQSAVIKFQQAKGLVADGIAGTKTQHALYGTSESGNRIERQRQLVSVTLYPVKRSTGTRRHPEHLEERHRGHHHRRVHRHLPSGPSGSTAIITPTASP
jgi:peptidoglycan hydrolase-like protein with peptidoglycan-binding domain